MKDSIAVLTIMLACAAFCETGNAGGQPGQPASAKSPLPAPANPNPLSFFDGKLTFDVEERLRGEFRENNFDFNDANDALTDDSWLLQRFRIGAKLKPLPFLTIYAQAQDVREFDSDRPNVIGQMGAEGDDAFDLRQGFIEIGDPKKFSFKIGRQILTYGDERLVGPLDWANQSRSFDAVKLHYERPTWWVDVFTSSVVKFDDGEFNESDWLDEDSARDQFFSGVYFSTTALGFQTTDLYVFQLHENGALGGTDFFTIGTRMKADPKKLGGFDYELETAVQFGEVNGRDLNAFAAHAGAGYLFQNAGWKPRIFAEYNFGSGDSDAADGDVGTFQNLFPTNHKFYGYMDVFSWQNLHNAALSFSVQPAPALQLQLDYHAFWLADTNDAWYRANGTSVVRPISPGAASFAGTELDFTVTWKPAKWLSVQAGYSHFFPGDYLSASGPSDAADFFYVQTGITF